MSLILIVEDNEKNMKLVRDVLQVKGYATIEAGTAEDGIRLARRAQARPRADGHPASRHERHRCAGGPARQSGDGRIPVIAVTASVMQQDRKLITEAGFDGYIGKPINLREFLDTVRNTLEARGRSAESQR